MAADAEMLSSKASVFIFFFSVSYIPNSILVYETENFKSVFVIKLCHHGWDYLTEDEFVF